MWGWIKYTVILPNNKTKLYLLSHEYWEAIIKQTLFLGPLLNTGFHFNVGNWPGHVEAPGSKVGTCDWLLTAETLKKSGDTEGIFLSVAHWYPPHTSCTYLMQGFPGQVVRLYFPRWVCVRDILRCSSVTFLRYTVSWIFMSLKNTLNIAPAIMINFPLPFNWPYNI